jgi:2-methylisocitrate lyase-like PEP mutase family enzyme
LQSKQLVSEEEFVTRIRAAVAAREESGRDIVIIARTDALQGYGYDEAIKRLKAAIAVGADVAFFEAVKNEEQMRSSIKDLSPTPCLVNMIPGGATPILTSAQAQEIGYRIMIWPVMLLSEVYANANRALKQLKETGYADPPKEGEGLIRELFEVAGLDNCAEFDAKVGGKAYEKV